MPKQPAKLTPIEILQQFNLQETEDQVAILNAVKIILQQKKDAASDEFKLIEGADI